jgi:diguanylate cyclase (GGDEF)-like protein
MLGIEWNRMARERLPLSLVILDVDHFKLYNDRYGHLAGDSCLRRVATALAGLLRRPADMVARYGGEEFAAILPGTGLEGAKVVAESMRQAVASLGIEHQDSPVQSVVTVSLGLSAVVPLPGCAPADLLQAADQGLYQAKQEGRDRWISFDCVPAACTPIWK